MVEGAARQFRRCLDKAVLCEGGRDMSEATGEITRSRPGRRDKVRVVDCRRSAFNRGGREVQSKPAAASRRRLPIATGRA